MEVLTPMKKEWEAFQLQLYTHLRIHEEPMWDMDEPTILTECDSTFRITRNVLTAHFDMYDLEGTIAYFKKSGWNCDCQLYSDAPGYLGAPE